MSTAAHRLKYITEYPGMFPPYYMDSHYCYPRGPARLRSFSCSCCDRPSESTANASAILFSPGGARSVDDMTGRSGLYKSRSCRLSFWISAAMLGSESPRDTELNGERK